MNKKFTNKIFKKFTESQNLPQDTQLRFRYWSMNLLTEEEREKEFSEIWERIQNETCTEFTFQQLEALNKKINHRKSNKLSIKFLLKIAAIICIPLLLSSVIYFFTIQSHRTSDINIMECFVPYGEKRQITLPDGTTAWINSSTILVYPNEFSGNTRTVFLNGEARFDVSKDPQKPFIVKTTFLDIEALGTVFNVSSYLDNFYTVATLEEGSIKVSLFDMNEPDIILNPNQQILYQHNSKDIEITQVEAENMGLWRTGELYFKGASFSHIMKSFERHFNVEIQYNPAKFKSQRITVRFSPEENIDDALIVLQAIIPNFKYEKCNNKIIIN